MNTTMPTLASTTAYLASALSSSIQPLGARRFQHQALATRCAQSWWPSFLRLLRSTAVEHWLTKEPTRIEITIEDGKEKKHLVFEGPNIKKSQPEIEALIDDLTKGRTAPLHVVAKRKNHPHAKPAEGCPPK